MDFIKEHKERGEKVYVHCKAGHGRAAAVALCWLMHENDGFTAQVSTPKTLCYYTQLAICYMAGIEQYSKEEASCAWKAI